MVHIALLNGSPSLSSSTAAVLASAELHLEALGHICETVHIRSLPAQALLTADTHNPHIATAIETVSTADALVVASPVYKASYTGLLKVFIDLIPSQGLKNIPVLPFVTGGSLNHVLALDYQLKPLLATLGATQIARGRMFCGARITHGTVQEPEASEIREIVHEFATHVGASNPLKGDPDPLHNESDWLLLKT